jgi:hypothetical protein
MVFFMDNTVKEYGQQNFSLPHDVVQLPSGGKFYHNKKKSVKVGYLTAADENIIMGSNNDDIVMSLVRSKLYEPDLRPEELLYGDLEAIMIFLRNSSFGPEYIVKLTDPDTNKQFEATILMDELYVKPTIVEPSERGTWVTMLPKSNVEVELKPLTIDDENEIERVLKSYPVGRAPKQTMRLAKQIVSIGGNSDRGYINTVVEQLPIMDSKHIRNFIADNEPRIDYNRIVIAPSGKELSVRISFGAEFFRPFF